MQEVDVRVPASTTNLGPGFDALGMALRLHNHIRLRRTAGPTRVEVEGEGAGILETSADNLVYQAVRGREPSMQNFIVEAIKRALRNEAE